MKQLLIILTVAFSFNFGISQNLKFGKISKEDIIKYRSEKDSTVAAEILYKHEDISFVFDQEEGFQQERKVHQRIIIYNKKGFNWATKKIRLYNRNNSNSEDLKSLKGITYTIEKNKLVKTKLDKGGVFEEILNKFWALKSFTMPNIKEGCVIEFSYNIKSPYLQINDIDFQSTIPIKKLDFRVKIPEYFKYSQTFNPRALFNPEIIQSNKSRTITMSGFSRSGYVVTKSQHQSQKLDFTERIYEVNMEDVPMLVREPFVDNIHNYKPKLILELKSINYPGQVMESFSTSWETVVENIYNHNDFGDELKKSNYYEEAIEELALEKDKTLPNTLKIFNYVKSKMKWNGLSGYLVDKGVKQAFKDGSGNVAEINLALIAILRSNNINANPVLISAKGNGIPIAPTRTGFNYVICMVENDDGYFLIDASDVNSTIDVLPEYVLNWQGRVVREDGSSSWISLQPKKLSKEIVNMNVVITPELKIEGKFRARYTGYLAKKYRDKYRGVNNEALVKLVEQNKNDIIIEDLKVKNENESNKPYDFSFNLTLNNEVESVGDNLYFDPLLLLSLKENPYKLEKRNYPINLNYPTHTKYIVNITIPDNYSVVAFPESAIYQLPEGKGEFKFMSKQQENVLLFSLELKLNTSFISTKDYENVKMFYDGIINKQKEQIVLTKA